MGQSKYEREVRALLKKHATFVRKGGRGHEIYQLKNGAKFTISSSSSSKGRTQNWKNNLGDLKRMISADEPVSGRRVTQEFKSDELPQPPKPPEERKEPMLNVVPTPEDNKSKETKKSHLEAFGVPWTEEEDKYIRDSIRRGLKDADIAKVLDNRTPSAIGQRRRALGINLRSPTKKKYKTRATSTTMQRKEPKKEKKPPVVGEYAVILRMPDGREVSQPITKEKAEELSLKILTGDL